MVRRAARNVPVDEFPDALDAADVRVEPELSA
jgi:hypothetical protein